MALHIRQSAAPQVKRGKNSAFRVWLAGGFFSRLLSNCRNWIYRIKPIFFLEPKFSSLVYAEVIGSLDKKYNLAVLCTFPDTAHCKYCISSHFAGLLVKFTYL